MSLPVIAPATEQPQRKVRLTPPIRVARNSFLSLCSELWTLLVVFIAMPALIRALGPNAFGLFSLAWVVLGYMAILDFGVSRAATKFISEHLARDQLGAVERVCRTAIASNLVLGFLGGAAVFALTPWLVGRIFHVPAQLHSEAHRIFAALALSVPVLLVQAVIRAVLCSYQKFGWISFLNSLAVTLQWGSALALTAFGFRIGNIVIVCVVVRALVTVAYAIVLAKIDTRFLGLSFSDFEELWRLLRFGGWVTISQFMTPVLLYLDRILVASLISLAAMTLYVVPYELIARLRVVPSSLVNALFPTLSEHHGAGSKESLQRLYGESLKYMLLILVPCFLLLAFLGSEIIAVWVGPEYAVIGGRVLRIMAGAALLNSLAYIPYAALLAFGRPDLPAKFHVAEVVLYLLLSFILIPRWGIAGAAWAVAVRLSVDAIALFWAARKYVQCSVTFPGIRRTIILNVALALILLTARSWPITAIAGAAGIGACLLTYTLAVWFFVLGEHERPLLLQAIQARDRVG